MESDLATPSQTVRIDSLSRFDARSLPLSDGSCALRFSSVYCIFPRTLDLHNILACCFPCVIGLKDMYIHTSDGRLKLSVSIIWEVAIFELDDIRSSSHRTRVVPICESKVYIQVGTIIAIHTTSTAPPFSSCASRLTIYKTLQRPAEPTSCCLGRPFNTTFLSFTRRRSTGNLTCQRDKLV